MADIKFNMHGFIRVKLTSQGLKTFAEFLNNQKGQKKKVEPKDVEKMKHKDGYFDMQLEYFMKVFGAEIGQERPGCFENEIILRTEDKKK